MLVVKALPQITVLAVYKSKSNDIAPSPSGKAGDFDSPIVGSTPAGATKPLGPRKMAGAAFLLFDR